MQIPWRAKALIYRGLDAVPQSIGNKAQGLLHKVMGSAWRDMTGEGNKYILAFERHFSIYEQSKIDLATAQFMGFGAGFDMAEYIFNYCRGLSRQHAIDIYRTISDEQVDRLRQVMAENPPPGAIRKPKSSLKEMGIVYDAPTDFRDLPGSAKFDIISTIDTLEHVEADELVSSAEACHRLLKQNGICVMSIDYTDHYSHSGGISAYNFLQFSKPQFAKYNSTRLYQNRVRHGQHRDIFTNAGFKVLSEVLQIPNSWDEDISKAKLHPDFAGLPKRDTAVWRATFVLAK